jgi:AcrR family transcriptional regulator
MGRPSSVNTEQILQAARELFLEQGFAVTTAAIARRAGISEGSIFKRFPSKEALFFAALGIPEPAWVEGLKERAGQGDVRENLVQIMLSMTEFFRELVPRLMMMWSCRALADKDRMAYWQRGDKEAPPLRGLAALCAYFERETSLGRLRVTAPEVAARMLLGAAQNYVLFEMVGIHVGPPLPAEEFARSVIDLLLRGMLP